MTEQAVTGMDCDKIHPFPLPRLGRGVDSMDYGATKRRPVGSIYDVNTTPTWRMVAAWMWGTDCVRQHIRELAADDILTTHLLACAAVIGLPPGAIVENIALGAVGAGEPVEALRTGGLKAGRRAVADMSVQQRESLIPELLSMILRGPRTLELDIDGSTVQKALRR
ncbi:hypothetical protein [Micromonospora sp. NPDC050695]|uniref:hypothetical protein n=1 Tax=Micromonospora sp. NPDC050695 TaxID=3154938 RepID=UPI0033C7DBE2